MLVRNPIKACGDIMANGQSFQQKADAVLTEGAEDPKMPAAMRVHLRLAQQQFDNLCAVDASLDTREAGQFFNEEADRLGRLAAASLRPSMRGGHDPFADSADRLAAGCDPFSGRCLCDLAGLAGMARSDQPAPAFGPSFFADLHFPGDRIAAHRALKAVPSTG